MTMIRSIAFRGNVTLVENDPTEAVFHDVIYSPAVWALFDHGRKLISASAYFRGPTPDLIASQYTTELYFDKVLLEAPDDIYFYLGPIHHHYGHFLISSLTRLWAYSKAKYPNIKILTYGTDAAVLFQKFSFMKILFGAFDLTADDFVTFEHPCRLRSVIIAAPCFEETNFCHQTFSRMFQTIQQKLLGGAAGSPSDVPIYLARYKLNSGVTSLVGEEEFATTLAASGVDIVFPESLSLIDQIRLLTDRSNICGFAGSAFHNVAFVPPRKLLSLNVLADPLSNQTLIDRSGGHDAVYLYSPDALEVIPPSPQFDNGIRLVDPKRTASEFLRILDPFMRVKPVTTAQERSAYGAADGLDRQGISRRNIALGRPTRQSSVGPFSLSLSAEENSAGAVCGFCTGNYQFCTEWEDSPWWDVDLGPAAVIGEIRLFNKLGEGAEFAANFALQASRNGETWEDLARCILPEPFGGLDGKPFCWQPDVPIKARYFRMRLMAPGRLHLDQVIVYGPS